MTGYPPGPWADASDAWAAEHSVHDSCTPTAPESVSAEIAGARTLRAIAAASLWSLAATSAFIGLPAALAPRAFYDDFPLGRAWVQMLPPYNEHLVGDVGGFYLAFALLFAWAAVSLQRALVVPLCTAWILAALLHFAYHATHLDGWNLGDAVAQTVLLALVLLLPVAAVVAVRRPAVARDVDAARSGARTKRTP